MTEQEIERILKDLSKSLNFTDKYFKIIDGKWAFSSKQRRILIGTDEMHEKFDPVSLIAYTFMEPFGEGRKFRAENRNVYIDYCVFYKILSKFESETKEGMLDKLTILLDKTVKKVEKNKDLEYEKKDRQHNRLHIKQKERINALEEQVETLEKEATSLKKYLEEIVPGDDYGVVFSPAMNKNLQILKDSNLLNSISNNKATEDCSLVDKKKCNEEDFEFIEDDYLSKPLNTC